MRLLLPFLASGQPKVKSQDVLTMIHIDQGASAIFVLQSGNAVISPKLFIDTALCTPCRPPGAITFCFNAQAFTIRTRYRGRYGSSCFAGAGYRMYRRLLAWNSDQTSGRSSKAYCELYIMSRYQEQLVNPMCYRCGHQAIPMVTPGSRVGRTRMTGSCGAA